MKLSVLVFPLLSLPLGLSSEVVDEVPVEKSEVLGSSQPFTFEFADGVMFSIGADPLTAADRRRKRRIQRRLRKRQKIRDARTATQLSNLVKNALSLGRDSFASMDPLPPSAFPSAFTFKSEPLAPLVEEETEADSQTSDQSPAALVRSGPEDEN